MCTGDMSQHIKRALFTQVMQCRSEQGRVGPPHVTFALIGCADRRHRPRKLDSSYLSCHGLMYMLKDVTAPRFATCG